MRCHIIAILAFSDNLAFFLLNSTVRLRFQYFSIVKETLKMWNNLSGLQIVQRFKNCIPTKSV